MAGHTPLSDVLRAHLSSVTNLHQLARDADVPLPTLHHWLKGRVRRPHTWQPLLRLAAALNLSAAQVDQLLGAANHPRLSQLAERAKDDKARALLARWTQSSAQPQPSHNLALGQLTSCIGREEAIATLLPVLARVRLLTLTGPGGCGKTRLALEVARSALALYSDGVFFVDLVPVSEPRLLHSAIAQALNIGEQAGGSLEQCVKTFLQERRLLLILDNFEHVPAAAPDVMALLQAAPHLTILVTSRSVLHIPGEQEWEVKPLPVPVPGLAFDSLRDSPAVVLFTERAQAVRPEFSVTPENAAVVAELCRRVDGLPLGIELAAARSRMFTPQAILEQFPASLNRRGVTSIPARHRSLDALLDWSHSLLDAAQQALFRRLSIFVGGFTLPAAQAICCGDGIDEQAVADLLSELVDRSLVQVEQQTQAGLAGSRYRLLETIRQYSLARLRESGEAAQLHTRHRDWYLALAEQADEELTGSDQQIWLNRLDQEYGNLRAALEWNSSQEDTLVYQLRFVASMWRYWDARGALSEGSWWHTALLARRPDNLAGNADASLWAGVLCGAGALANALGDYVQARAHYDESLRLYRSLGERRGSAAVLTYLGVMAHDQGDYREATRLYEQSLAFYQELGDASGIAWTLNTLGNIAHVQCDYARARELFERSRALWRQQGNARYEAWLVKSLGTLACDQGEYIRARRLFEECLQVFREVGDQLGIGYALINLGRLARYQGDAAQAIARLEEGLAIMHAIGNKWGTTIIQNHLGSVARDQGDDTRAAAQFEEGLRLSRELGNRWTIAWALNDLGDIARDRGDLHQALRLYRESLALRDSLGDRGGIAYVLESLAELSCLEQNVEHAARLWGAAEWLRTAFGVPLPAIEAERYRRVVADARGRINADRWAAAWQHGRHLPLAQLIAPWDQDDQQPVAARSHDPCMLPEKAECA